MMTAQARQFYTFPYAVSRSVLPYVQKSLISIVLPVYNHAQYLTESIKSVFKATTWPCELIIVNDGSTDGFEKVVNLFRSDSRIRIISQQNAGLSAALNRGFGEARGNFLSWTSADNMYLPGALDALAQFLTVNSSLGLVYANVELMDDADKPLTNSNYRSQDQDKKHSEKLLLPINTESLTQFPDNFINSCFLYRRSAALLVGGYLSSFNGLEDYDYWLRLARFYPIAHLDSDEPFYRYRLHADSLTHTLGVEQLASRTRKRLADEQKRTEMLVQRLSFRLNHAAGAELPLVVAALTLRGHRVEESIFEQNEDSAVVASLVPILDAVRAKSTARWRSLDFIRPPSVSNQLSYRRDILRIVHGGQAVSPLIVETIPISKSHTDIDSAYLSSFTLVPPLQLPKVLLRARGSDFEAIIKTPGSTATALLFGPTGTESTLARIIEALPDVTFAVLCTNAVERHAADRVNLSLKRNNTFRIIDLNELCSEPHDNSWPSEQLLTALLYVLSSADLILSLWQEEHSLASLLELRAEAALCAAAGIPLISISPHEELTRLANTPNGDLLGPDQISYRLSAFNSAIFPIPHLVQLGNKEALMDNCSVLSKTIREVSTLLDHRIAQQWLLDQSLGKTGQIIENLVLA